MTELKQVYRCNICGNIVEVLHAGVGTLVCCGQPMELLAEKTADVALMEDDLSKVPYLAELCGKTLRIVKENITASILIKGAFAVLAVLGLVSLWLAVAVGDMGLSFAVILNAIRLSSVEV